jgi:hypothetical protein
LIATNKLLLKYGNVNKKFYNISDKYVENLVFPFKEKITKLKKNYSIFEYFPENDSFIRLLVKA